MSILTLATRTASVIRPLSVPVRGRLYRRGLDQPVGHAYFDRAGTDDVVVTESREASLLGPQAPVRGLTVHVERGAGEADLTFVLAATTWSRVSRRVRPEVPGLEWTMTGVLADPEAADGADGGEPLLVAARMVGGHTAELAVARQGQPWQEFGCLLISAQATA
ncbi:hypothetical protein GGQ22_02925 [Nocardioides sp. zg-579]|uniref:Uncharacterized protein n=1 Tax=Nocardioides marmotae TaxID=2663857 RepID=A0A6I3J194_9ACTN|nr:hypothetical protein [Nocardioides marmotae]MCR6030391.1 hypothetical protein [Gordonia jinghuaiqii]MTB94026.1 hypothetical protein [Nocardioides marmotae]QKE00336.1 hypothetical protein HPC71_04005 [Nocardioides marmotae]